MTGKDKGNLDRILEGNAEPKKKVRRRVKKQPEKKGILLAKKIKKTGEKMSTGKSSGFDQYAYDVTDRKPTVNEIGPSKFRQKSADWMSDMEDGVQREHHEMHEGFQFKKWIKALTPVQWAAGFMAIVLFITSITGTVVYADYKSDQKLTEAFAQLETYEAMAAASEITSAELEAVEVPLAMEEAPEQDETATKTLSLVLTSVEKDLKIKVVDGEDTLVKGIAWKVIVTDESDKTTELVDDDKDGVIHAKDMAAGDYSVALIPDDSITEYTFPSEPMMVAVKAKVEYKVIQDIRDAIKTEAEVNVAAEDTGGKQAADVETSTALTDTVEFVESTKTPKGTTVDGYVESAVHLEYTAKAPFSSSTLFADVLNSLKASSTSGLSLYNTLSMPVGLLSPTTSGNEIDDKTTIAVTDVALSSPTLSLVKGATAPLVATVSPDNATNKNVNWESDNPSIATVENGTVIAKGKGSATIKASCENKSASCTVTVTEAVATTYTFSITTPSNLKAKGTKGTITYSGSGSGGETITGVTYSAYDNSLISVEGQTVTVLKDCTANTSSNVTATATYSDGHTETKTASVTVLAIDQTLSITGADTVKVGEIITLTANVGTVTWKSSNEAIAKVTGSGATATVTGVKASNDKITITATSDGISATKQITVTATYADTAQLYDSAKNKLYVLEGTTYRLATYADYKSGKFSKYYKKSAVDEYLYTGWQTLNGLTYYFKKDNTKVTGEQVIGGVKYTFDSDGALSQGNGTLGIDVSKYQPSINWASVKASGISYVIIRCGYRGSSTGVLVEDPYFRSHIKGAKAAGLKVGVYFFTTAITEAEAVEEASMCAALCSGYGLNYPVFMDCESSNRAGYMSMSAAQRTSVIKAFCSTIRSAGYTPGVYANKTWLTSYMNASELSGYKIWLAQYNSQVTYKGRYDLWQFTSKGSVNGISGNVDMNQSYLGY